MNRKWIYIIAAIVVVACCAVTGFVSAVLQAGRMRALMEEVRVYNQADSIFTDSRDAHTLVDYYGEPLRFWISANDRMEAHYLLGRAYADIGETPRAIEEYCEAVECADTTSADCDLRTLRAIYGQMANVFHQQNLPQDGLQAQENYVRISRLMKDTLQIGIGLENLTRPYYLMGDTTNLIRTAEAAADVFYSIGRRDKAANALNTVAFIEAQRGHIEEAQRLIELIRRESTFFDSQGNLRPGREMFYYTIGLYFENSNQLDSAEYYYRKLIPAKKIEAAYRGLLSVYQKREIADSIGKLARMYADANDAAYDKMSTQAVAQATKSYQYTRERQQAEKHRSESRRRGRVIVGILLALCCGAVVIWRWIKKEKETNRRKWQQLSADYERSQTACLQAMEDVGKMQEDLFLFQTKKQDEVEQLLDKVTYYEEQYRCISLDKRYDAFYCSEIVQKFQTMGINPRDKLYPSKHDWEVLTQLFRLCFGEFYDAKHVDKILTEKEWHVCLLTELGFTTGRIAQILHTGDSSVTRFKGGCNRKLFGISGASTLQANFRSAIRRRVKVE